jgi:hypothetical protein
VSALVRFRRVVPVALFALALTSAPALVAQLVAQNVGVRAYLTPGTTVGVGRQFVLNLEVTGVRRVDRDPVLPDLAAFAQYLGSGTSTSMEMAGGQTTVALTVQYRFQALVEGTFQIEPLQVAVGGQTYNTEVLPLTVASAPPAPGAANGSTDAGGIAPADLFVEAEASRTTVLVGEPLTIEYRIWTRLDVTSFSLTSEPEREGFWVEGLGQITQPQVEQRLRNGQQYTTALIQRVALIPTGAGQRTIEPLGIEAQVRVSRSNDPLDRLFGRSPLFGRATVVPAAVLSNSLSIQVDALPAGRPEPFSGVVGALALTAEVDRDELDANDAVTLTIRVSAQGNVRAIPEPVLDLPRDFEVFPPEIVESVEPSGDGLSGSKVFEYVLIPRTPGERMIPSVSMGYFDAASGSYGTARTDEIPLLVTGEINEPPVSLQRVGVAQLREDIRFIRLGDGALRSVESFLFQGAAFWTLLLLPMAAVLGALGLRRHWDRLEGDVAYARGRRAGRVAKKRLATAQGLVREGDSRAFFAEVANALRGFVADRLNVAEAGMQIGELRVSLAGRGVSTESASDFLACLEQCDRQRFAPAGAEIEERIQFLERAGAAMTMLDGALR